MPQKLSKKLQDDLKKKLIQDEAQLVKRIDELHKEDPFNDPDHANDNAAIDTDVREQVGHDTIIAQITSLSKKLDNVKHAFKKTLKGKYGVCESCGVLIVIERLQLIPEAKYCIHCEKRLVK